MLDRIYWLGFSAFPGVGPIRFKLLKDYFGTAKAAWEASVEDLLTVGLGERLTHSFDTFRREFSLRGYNDQVKKSEVFVLTLEDEKYPRLLKEISDAPFVLYIKGKKKQSDTLWDITRSVGVVGTRRITPYGKDITSSLSRELAHANVTVVSGLAYGVDAVAHQIAIDAGGKTIAVLGCGVDCCNPRGNQHIYDAIMDGNGMIVSEFPLSQRASKGLFPARNRIISGLSLGIVVTEGTEDSGALITASYAAEQGRDVFAVPGPINSAFSKATNTLLKKGAKLVESAEDILSELSLSMPTRNKSRRYTGDNDDEHAILDLLYDSPKEGNELIRTLKWPIPKATSILSLLEIKGIIKQERGVYSLK